MDSINPIRCKFFLLDLYVAILPLCFTAQELFNEGGFVKECFITSDPFPGMTRPIL